MKIERIETYLPPERTVAVVQVYTGDGLQGTGQTAWNGADITVSVLHQLVAPFFLGQNPWDLASLMHRCLSKNYKFTGTFLYRALCGVETAIWDLLGHATGQPVYRLLGGAVRSEIPVYASSLSRGAPEAEAERMVGLVQAQGFRCVKIKVGERMGRDRDAAPGRTERIVPLMREALGPDVAISADANGGFSAPRAIRVGRLLEQHNYFHFEEPCPFHDLKATAQVAAALDIPVAGGEQDSSLHHYKRLMDERVVDIVQVDVGYVGGLSRARKVAEMAELAGMPCTPHNSGHSLLQVFTMHLAAAMPACYHYQEWRADAQPWTDDLYGPHLEVSGGSVTLPDRPGWGVAVPNAFLRRATLQVSKGGA